MNLPIPLFLTLLLIGLAKAAEKSSAATGDKDGKVKSESRNGEMIDQIAEESRISEVEAAEKSYANSGPPPVAPPQQGPPPIPVPVPVQVRPGALVLPSPGRNAGGNKPPPGYAKHADRQYDNAQAQSGVVFQNDMAPPPNNHRNHPPPQQQQQGNPAPQPHPMQGHPGQSYPPHPGMNMPVHPGNKQQFHQQQAAAAQMKHQVQQQILSQLQGLQLPPHMSLPQPGPVQKLDANMPYNQGQPQAQAQQQVLVQVQSQQQQKAPQQKANNQAEVMPQQASHPVPQVQELGVAVMPSGGGGGGHFPGFAQMSSVDQWQHSAPEMPQILHLEAKCEKNSMKVAIKFDKPFFGVVFSKGNYDNENCVYMRPGQGHTSATFDIAINGCGTTGNTQNGLYGFGEQTGSGSFFENTIVVQYDPFVQEVWDQARKLRCSWHDYYEKSVTFKPFNVEMLDIVHTDFAGDNVGCWMQIQAGKGPWANEVSGIVKIGQTLTMVLAIKDEENKFDMLVRDCVAHDGKRNPIELVNDRGCIVRPKLMSKFTKIKNFGTSASVMSYAHFQAFKFPDSMDVHFQCTIQICRYQCPEQCAHPIEAGSAQSVITETLQKPAAYIQGGRPRLERALLGRMQRSAGSEVSAKEKGIGVNGNIKVVSSGDLAFNLDSANNTATVVYPLADDNAGLICISTPSFTITLVFLLAILVISCIVSTFLCLRHRTYSTDEPGSSTDRDIYKPKLTFYEFLRRGGKY